MANARDVDNRWPITISIMLCSFMQALDTTIANVSLPHMQGSVSASYDQITWVLTSYIVATAVMTPITGWIADRVGRKRVFMVSIIVFTLASMLCGIANSLPELVVFRFLQGLAGAAFIPLSQAVLLDIHPPEQHGKAMAIWAGGSIVAPVLGPVLGGLLTEHLSWRWCFYINVPTGMIALLGVWTFMSGDTTKRTRPFDFLGFAMLALFVTSFQLMLDRGPGLDWFSKREIWIEAILAAMALWVFVMHSLTAEHPFFDPALLADRNFLPCAIFGFINMMMLMSIMALIPPLTQTLLGYPVVSAGWLMMPRGVGSLLMMFIIGPLCARFDPRHLMVLGTVVTAVSTYQMTRFNLQSGGMAIMTAGFIQGVGMGFLFVPITMLAFATMRPNLRAEGSSMFALMRNLGGSVGISIMQALIATNAQTMHASIAGQVDPTDAVVRGGLTPFYDPSTAAGAMALNAEITRQATMVSYLDIFRLMTGVLILSMPLVFILRRPRRTGRTEEIIHVAD